MALVAYLDGTALIAVCGAILCNGESIHVWIEITIGHTVLISQVHTEFIVSETTTGCDAIGRLPVGIVCRGCKVKTFCIDGLVTIPQHPLFIIFYPLLDYIILRFLTISQAFVGNFF